MNFKQFRDLDDIHYIDDYSFDDLFDYHGDLPSIDDVFPDREIADWDNPVRTHTILTCANPGDGKDHFWRHYLNKITEFYDIYPSIHVEKDDLFSAYKAIDDNPIQIIVVPDMTNLVDRYKASERSDLIQLHVKRRHLKMEAMKPNKKGLILMVFGIHRLHGLAPAWSTNYNQLNWRSLPTNQYDLDVFRTEFGNNAVWYMDQIERLRQKDNFYIGFSLMKTKTQRKICYNPLILPEK